MKTASQSSPTSRNKLHARCFAAVLCLFPAWVKQLVVTGPGRPELRMLRVLGQEEEEDRSSTTYLSSCFWDCLPPKLTPKVFLAKPLYSQVFSCLHLNGILNDKDFSARFQRRLTDLASTCHKRIWGFVLNGHSISPCLSWQPQSTQPNSIHLVYVAGAVPSVFHRSAAILSQQSKERHTSKEFKFMHKVLFLLKKQTHKQNFNTLGSLSQIPTTTNTGPGWSWEPGTPSESPVWETGSRAGSSCDTGGSSLNY